MGDATPWNWKGDEAGYQSLHGYLRRHYPKTGICEECGSRSSRTEYALIKGRAYSRNREDYRELCRRCHMRYDNGGRKHTAETRAKVRAATIRTLERERREGRKRRMQKGEGRYNAKLTADQVREIRHTKAQGFPLAPLAARYGVAVWTIYSAARGDSWAHITAERSQP